VTTATRGPRRGRIRILLVTVALVPGGAERQMLLLAEGLPRSEFQLDVICLESRGSDADRAEAVGARVRVLGLRRRRAAGLPLPIYPVYLAWTVARFVLMTAGRYDVVDAWLYHAYALCTMTRFLTRPKALISGRRSLSGFKGRFNVLERIADAVARRATDVFVANSMAVKEDVVRREGLAPSRIRVIRNGVQPIPPMTDAERRRLRAAWGAGPDTIVVGCVANYKPFKGLELLIRSIARLAAEPAAPDLRLVLVGEGRLRPDLEAERATLGAERMVILHGSEPDARNLYGAFDIAAHASEAEGLPNVVLEAAAAALPIVATDAGGTREIISDGTTGLLVPVGDEDAMVSALDRLRRDPGERARLGEAARADILERFATDRMVGEFATLYRELAAPGGPRRARGG
jgi:glycosyltransferase involved in cell wall biosynthesis